MSVSVSAACSAVVDSVDQVVRGAVTHAQVTIEGTLGSTLVEHVGGRVDPTCAYDAWQARALQPLHYAVNTKKMAAMLPSDAVMAATKAAVQVLVREDPAKAVPAWAGDFAHHQSALPSGVPANVWYKNDIHGVQYFAACSLPGSADSVADRIWHPTAFGHINSTNAAPQTVVAELCASARMECHVMPEPHMLSDVVASGMEFDAREALVLTMRDTMQLHIGGVARKAHLIWMKSAEHPAFSGEGAEVTSPRCTQTQKGLLSARVGSGDVLASVARIRESRAPLARRRIMARGFLVFETEEGASTLIFFGHEQIDGLRSQLGRIAHYMGLGEQVSGGCTDMVDHVLSRVCNVVG